MEDFQGASIAIEMNENHRENNLDDPNSPSYKMNVEVEQLTSNRMMKGYFLLNYSPSNHATKIRKSLNQEKSKFCSVVFHP